MKKNIPRWVRIVGLVMTLAGTLWSITRLPGVFSRDRDCAACRMGVIVVFSASLNIFAHLMRAELRAYKSRRKKPGA